MDTNKLIKKKLRAAKEYAKELAFQLDKCQMLRDGGCIICGANPEIFVKYLESTIEETIQARDEWWKKKLKPLLKYRQDHNGLPYCKNCGLSEEFLNNN